MENLNARLNDLIAGRREAELLLSSELNTTPPERNLRKNEESRQVIRNEQTIADFFRSLNIEEN